MVEIKRGSFTEIRFSFWRLSLGVFYSFVYGLLHREYLAFAKGRSVNRMVILMEVSSIIGFTPWLRKDGNASLL